jgi:hypothetical protein
MRSAIVSNQRKALGRCPLKRVGLKQALGRCPLKRVGLKQALENALRTGHY